MNVDKIEDLEGVLSLDSTKTITDYKIQRLTAAGENYGSLMLSINIDLKTPTGTEHLKTVGKLVPPNEFVQMVFNTQVSFRNEIAIYKHIIPTLQAFQREQGMKTILDLSPRYFGSRLNLNYDDSAKVDSNAILLLENLKVANYIHASRFEGFDLDAAKLIIRDLAHLHAVSLGLKVTKPDVFQDKVRRHLTAFAPPPDGASTIINNLRRHLEQIEECRPWVEKVMAILATPPTFEAREPFATLVHSDCWVNNTMVKYEGPVPVRSKLVDFQVCDYGSPATDLLFFIFTSIKNHVVEQHYEYLVKYYHNIFAKVLRELKCDTDKFSFEAFLKEIDYEARHSQLGHIVIMLFPIFKPKGKMVEISEFTPSTFAESTAHTTPEHKRKLAFVVKQFAQRGWI